MKVGDLVYDASLGMNGVIFDVIDADPDRETDIRRRWIILYEDGHSSEAYDGEIEVINENR